MENIAEECMAEFKYKIETDSELELSDFQIQKICDYFKYILNQNEIDL